MMMMMMMMMMIPLEDLSLDGISTKQINHELLHDHSTSNVRRGTLYDDDDDDDDDDINNNNNDDDDTSIVSSVDFVKCNTVDISGHNNL